MLKITNVTIKNFLSVGNVTQAVRLDESGLTLVLGANTDANGGLTRNGAGKSTILQAVSYAMFGKPLTKIKLPNLINNINGKQMLVTIEFEVSGRCYRVERGKKPDVMKFYIDTQEQHLDTEESKGENRHTQAEIDRLLGMSHTMFKHIVALNTFTDPFLKMSVGDQRSVIEELLGVTQISQRADTLRKLIVQTKDRTKDHQATIKATVEANERITTAIRLVQSKAETWTTNHNAKLAQLAEELAAMATIDYEEELTQFDAIEAFDERSRSLASEVTMAERESTIMMADIAARQRERASLVRESQNSSTQQRDRLVAELGRREADERRAAANVTKAQGCIAQLIADIENADGSICICCQQPVAGTDHLATILANLADQQRSAEAELARHEADAATFISEASSLRTEIAAAEADAAERAFKIEDEIALLDEQLLPLGTILAEKIHKSEIAKAAVAALGTRPKSLFRNRDEVYRARSEHHSMARNLEHETQLTNPHGSQVIDLENALKAVDYEPIKSEEDLLAHQEFLLKLLVDKNSFIRKKIIDQNLAYLNSRMNNYLDKLGLPHEVTFQSDLSVDITQLGRDMDFEQLSRGEMNRVIMATSWSFRDVWESQNQAINLCWIDELLDNGLDQQGVEAALGVLKGMARDRGKNVFLISHREELQARIDKTLLVTKENGFTAIQAE